MPFPIFPRLRHWLHQPHKNRTHRFSTWLAGLGLCLASATGFAAPFAYIADQATNQVFVVDMATYTTISTLTLGSGVYPPNTPVYPTSVVANEETGKVYVGDSTGISIIDAVTNTIVGRIPLAGAVLELAVNTDGDRAYALTNGAIQVIDVAAKKVIATIATASSASGLAINHAGSKLYVANSGSGGGAAGAAGIAIIDTATNAIETTINTASAAPGLHPNNLAVSPQDDRVYAIGLVDNSTFNGFGNTYLALDTATNAVKAVNPATSETNSGLIKGIAFNADGSRVYIGGANFTNPFIAEIDPAAEQITRIIPLPSGGAEYHYTKGLASSFANNKFVLAGFVFEHRIHSAAEPRSAAFVDATSGTILNNMPFAQTGLFNSYVIGDILDALPAPGITPTTTSLTAPTKPVSRHRWISFVATVAGTNPTGKVTFKFTDERQRRRHVARVKVPLNGNVASYSIPACTGHFDDHLLKRIVCRHRFQVTAKYSGDQFNAKSQSAEYEVVRH